MQAHPPGADAARAALPDGQNRRSEGTVQAERGDMGIDRQSDIAANIQIGPTDQGMVRIYIEAEGGIELPLDFDPEEAEEIAEEIAVEIAVEIAMEMAVERPSGRCFFRNNSGLKAALPMGSGTDLQRRGLAGQCRR